MKSLSGLDAAFLHLETPETPMHVGSLHLYDPPARRERDLHAWFRRHVATRMRETPIAFSMVAPSPLRFANPVWVDAEKLDLDYHIKRVALPRPGTQDQLDACVAKLHSPPLDRRRPLWQFYLIEGLKSGQFAVYTKVHHALIDGVSGVVLVQGMLDSGAGGRRVSASKRARAAREPAPSLRELIAAALEHDADRYGKLLGLLPGVFRGLAGILRTVGNASEGNDKGDEAGAAPSFLAPRTAMNGTITRARGFASASLPLDAVKAIARRHGATLNDVVLALCSGAMRRYLQYHGGIPARPLLAVMPVSMREAGDVEPNAQVTLTRVSLATDVEDPGRRLAAIHASAGGAKAAIRKHHAGTPTDLPSLGMPWLLSGLAAAYGNSKLADAMPPIANAIISNVPGPNQPLYLAGARMRTFWPVSIVEHGTGPNISVISYCGSLDFGITVARCNVPDARRLTEALHQSFEELRHAKKRATGTKA